MLRVPVPSGFVGRPACALLALLVFNACATGKGTISTGRAQSPPTWPAIPSAVGPLAIRVQYPSPNALIAARDSTFLLGSVQLGGATLTINGAPVVVRPNGAFLAWVAMPPRSQPQFALIATGPGGDTQRLTLPIRLPAERLPVSATAPPYFDTATVTPRSGLVLRGDELVRVSARLADGAQATITPADCSAIALASAAPLTSAAPLPMLAPLSGDVVARDVPARALRCGATLSVLGRGDAVPATRALPSVGDADSLGYYRIGTASADTDAVVIARPIPGGTYKWFLLPGTVLRATGKLGNELRVELDRGLDVWIDADAASPLPIGSPAPRRVVSNARVVPDSGYVDLVLPLSVRPAYRVEAEGSTLRLTLHGTTSNTDIVWFQRSDSLVRDVQWTNDATDRAVFTVHLQHAVYGWLAFWRGDAFVLRIRRLPTVNLASPLRGLRIAVDPGHPPAGSTGPTGLYEGVATLAIGERVQRMLTERGAVPIMMRASAAPVALNARPILARQADAHAFVSIHLNAKPDGANPYRNNGSGTYYFQPQSAPLARAIQARLLVQLGLTDDGTWFDNLAVVRQTWMPSVLVEGAYVIVPEQEAALRTPEFQEAYARAIVEGLENWFRSIATSSATP